MILDSIVNAKTYLGISKNLDEALELMSTQDFSKHQDGRFEVDGDRIYGLVQTYRTEPRAPKEYETHQRYIDIQMVLSGVEVTYVRGNDELTVTTPYAEDKDAELSQGDDENPIVLKPGWFAVFFPQDAHKPCCDASDESKGTDVRKAILKVQV